VAGVVEVILGVGVAPVTAVVVVAVVSVVEAVVVGAALVLVGTEEEEVTGEVGLAATEEVIRVVASVVGIELIIIKESAGAGAALGLLPIEISLCKS